MDNLGMDLTTYIGHRLFWRIPVVKVPETPETPFLRAIADPDDNLPRLVFADWLDERGEPWGGLIREQVANGL
jgi:uncharacterized protein (TIGR02996 family)